MLKRYDLLSASRGNEGEERVFATQGFAFGSTHPVLDIGNAAHHHDDNLNNDDDDSLFHGHN